MVAVQAEKEKAQFEAAKAAYVPSEAYQQAAEIVQNGKAVRVQKVKSTVRNTGIPLTLPAAPFR